jgi:hypothetical protein
VIAFPSKYKMIIFAPHMIKRFTLILFVITLGNFSFAHNYYFSFTEVEYNDFCGCFEASITFTTHDFEQLLSKKNILNKNLESTLNDYQLKQNIETIINEGFQITLENKIVEFQLDGNEIGLNGLTTFFLSSKPIKLSSVILFQYNLLMNEFPEQQNKLTFIFRGEKTTMNFIANQFTHSIKLEK